MPAATAGALVTRRSGRGGGANRGSAATSQLVAHHTHVAQVSNPPPQQQQQQQQQLAARASMDSLRGALCEIDMTLRLKIQDDAALSLAAEEVKASLAFLSSLAEHSERSGVLQGAAFQQLLRSCGPSMGHLGRTPTVKDSGGASGTMVGDMGVVTRVFNDPATTIRMAMGAQKLINLVRVKLEDDNDLNLARRCLGDAQRCLSRLRTHAAEQGVTGYDLYRQLS